MKRLKTANILRGLICIAFFISVTSHSQQNNPTEVMLEGKTQANLPFRYFPSDEPNRPLIIFFHGAGEKLDRKNEPHLVNIKQISTPTFRALFNASIEYNVNIAAPHMFGKMDVGHSGLLTMIPDIVEALGADKVDLNRVIVTGLSEGAGTTVNLARTFPEQIAAAVPLSGSMLNVSTLEEKFTESEKINTVPIWIITGEADGVFNPDYHTRRLFNYLQATGNTPRYTEIPGLTHTGWDRMYSDNPSYTGFFIGGNPDEANSNLWTWMLNQSLLNRVPFTPSAFSKGDSILFDFGFKDMESMQSPDSSGNYWNHPPEALEGLIAKYANNTRGEKTPISFEITDPFYDDATVGLENTSVADDFATRDSWTIRRDNFGEITIRGLNDNATYELKLFSSTPNANNYTRFEVAGQYLDLLGTNNRDTFATFENLTPINGELKVLVRPTPNKAFTSYLNFLQLTAKQSDTQTNATPIAENDNVTINQDSTTLINVLSNDYDPDNGPQPIQIQSTGEASNGVVSIEGNQLRYTPNTGFVGQDQWSYQITDGDASAQAQVSVDVQEIVVNIIPVAEDDYISVTAGNSVLIPVLNNDSDPDQSPSPLQIVSVTQATQGTAVIENQDIRYNAPLDYEGEATFSYQVTDGEDQAMAQVIVSVEPATTDNMALILNQDFTVSDVVQDYTNRDAPTVNQLNDISAESDGGQWNIENNRLKLSRTGANGANNAAGFYRNLTNSTGIAPHLVKLDIQIGLNPNTKTWAPLFTIDFGEISEVSDYSGTMPYKYIRERFTVRGAGSQSFYVELNGVYSPMIPADGTLQSVSIFLNSGDTSESFEGPDGGTHTIAPMTSTVFINQQPVFENEPQVSYFLGKEMNVFLIRHFASVSYDVTFDNLIIEGQY